MKKLLVQILLLLLVSFIYAQQPEKKEFQIVQKFIIFQNIDNRIRIREVIIIDSDRWDLPEQFVFLESIPDNSDNLQFQNSIELELSGNSVSGLIQSGPDLITEFTYTYSLKDIDNKIKFKSNYFIQNFDIYVPVQMGIKLNDPSLILLENYNLDQNEFLHYTAQNIEKNAVIEPDISRVKSELVTGNSRITYKSPSFHSAGHIRLWYQTPFKKINPHFFTLIITGMFITAVFLIIRKNLKESSDTRVGSIKNDLLFETLFTKKKKILNEILSLYNELNEQKINQNTYIIGKEKLKTQLIEINRKLNQIVNRDQDVINDSI